MGQGIPAKPTWDEVELNMEEGEVVEILCSATSGCPDESFGGESFVLETLFRSSDFIFFSGVSMLS